MDFTTRLIKYIAIMSIVTTVGILYDKFKSKYIPDEELEKIGTINKYLLGDGVFKNKPVLWIHTCYDTNCRKWETFGSRNTKNLNQPYLNSCLETIVKKCGNSFNICLIDDDSFEKLLPGWDVNLCKLSDPIREHIRYLGLVKLLKKYGGMLIPDSFIANTDLISIYNSGVEKTGCFVGSCISRSNVSATNGIAPNKYLIGCRRDNETIKNYVNYLEVINSRDYTNEVDFCGEIERYLMDLIKQKKIVGLGCELFGVKDITNKIVDLDRLMSSTYIRFPKNMVGIYIPKNELSSRQKYNWFIRQSQHQLKTCDVMLAKWLLICQNQ